MKMLLFYVVFGLTVCSGCRRESPAGCYLLDEHFDGFSLQMQHGEYRTGVALKPGEEPAELRQKLIDYLSGKDKGICTDFPEKYQNLAPPLRSRDFWALALAQLSNAQLTFSMTDDDRARDQKIDALLAQVQGARR